MKRLTTTFLLIGVTVWVAALSVRCGEPPVEAVSDPAAIVLLTDAIEGSSAMTYIGIVERIEQNPMEAKADRVLIKMFRNNTGGYRYELLEPEERAGSYFVRNGKEIAFSKDFDAPLFRRMRRYRNFEYLIRNLKKLEKNYAIQFSENEMIAGREAKVLILSARDSRRKRPSMTMWIDVETKKVLGAERRAPGGAVTFSYRFREIDLAPEFQEETFALPKERKQWAVSRDDIRREDLAGGLEEAKTLFPFAVRPPSYLCDGFELERVRRVKTATGQMCLIVYSDGLTALTVGIKDPNTVMLPKRKKRTVSEEDKDHVHTKQFGFYTMYARTLKDIRVMVISELEQDEVLLVLNSLEDS